MSKRDPFILLDDMVTALSRIERYRGDMTREQFLSDEKTVDAIVRNIEVIGEASRQLPPEFTESHESVPWHQMAGMRNRIVHDYFGIDVEIIWQVVIESLPALKQQITEIVKNAAR